MLDGLRKYARFAAGLPRFLRERLGPSEARRRIEGALARREAAFLAIVEHAIFENERSPYRALLRHAGIGLEDLARLVADAGIEGALGRLYDAGVYVRQDEWKGHVPIRRPGGLELAAGAADFDNPLVLASYEGQTGGSRGAPRRVLVDLDLLAHEAAYDTLYVDAFGIGTRRPVALWRGVPPVTTGLRLALRHLKIGLRVERWFAQSGFGRDLRGAKFAALTAFAVAAARAAGRRLPFPRFVPRRRVALVARWLAEKRRAGDPAILDTNASSGVRVCAAARELGLDISGTFFRMGGEPYTAGKARTIAGAGCRAAVNYGMNETGAIGMACARPSGTDDVHLMTDKVAAIQREKAIGAGGGGVRVGALVLSTILPSSPKVLLNVESGDFGTMDESPGPCGCPFGALGFATRIRDIRSYEKLTSEGVTFLGSELIRLIELDLPARFGGGPLDYQLVEEEDAGLARVSLLVSPRVGRVDERALLAAVLDALGGRAAGGDDMADQWRQGRTLRLVRREPYATGAEKVLPLHVVPKG